MATGLKGGHANVWVEDQEVLQYIHTPSYTQISDGNGCVLHGPHPDG